uniref:retron Ec78 anti-phage system effector ATPase PtuA n=1 Tax=Cellvibrio fontiphilus TaxID=1815559 RepID=UPI002B4C1195|nr:retron Ec78 anti-phage system effector ATPase PtuA [Cellvibrio fontiphilus]
MKSSGIRALERNANEGSIKSAFQLFEYYTIGKFVDKNPDLAKKYSDIVFHAVKNSAFKVSSLTLKNFKSFSDLQISICDGGMSDQLTVFSGLNGAGKSTVLDAISKSLSWISYRLVAPKSTGESIDFFEIHSFSDYATIIANIDLGGEKFQIDLSKSSAENPVQKSSVLAEFSLVSDIYRHLISIDRSLNLPIIAFYGVERAVDVSNRDERVDDALSGGRQERFDGYKKALTGSADFKLFFKWFKYHQDVANSSGANSLKKIRAVEAKAKKLTETIEKLERSDTPNGSLLLLLNKVLDSHRKEIDSINSGVSSNNSDFSARVLRVVTDAISVFLPDFSNFRIQYEPFVGMIVDKNGVSLSVQQLSQGEKSLLALIADIARRLVLLNPSLDNPLMGNGIVMIDEVDLHLHPAWQQRIIIDLRRTFPNIQFIISTHSPQVLSTVPKECIRTLGKGIDGKDVAATPKSFSYGMPSNDVMEAIMHVNPQPPVPEEIQLKELTNLVDQGLYGSDRALALLGALKSVLTEKHPQLEKIERSIRRQEALKR